MTVKRRSDIQRAIKALDEGGLHARQKKIQNIVLSTLYVGGMLSAVVLMPNAVRLFASLDPAYRAQRERLHSRLIQAASRLEARGLLSITGIGKEREIKLTAAGEALIEDMYAGEYEIPTPFRWDRKWRLIMFDVPERRRKVRDTLRFLLRNAGFVRFQDSAWAHPYPCSDLVQLLRTELGSGKGEVRYVEVSFPEADDKALKEQFGLS